MDLLVLMELGKLPYLIYLQEFISPHPGTIRLDNENIVGKSPSQICQTGIARTFQNIRLFNNMTVLENVKAAFHKQVKYSLLASFLHSISFFSGEKEMDSRALELLKVFGLDTFANDYARNLSYGAQRKLEIARALATNPKLLLLDEPAAGMNPQETSELMDTIKLIRERFHVTILLIEHDMKLVSGICENILVLNFGTELANGTPDEVLTT